MLIVSVREKQDVRFIGTRMGKKGIFYWSEFFFFAYCGVSTMFTGPTYVFTSHG